jgi:hypothetical protein
MFGSGILDLVVGLIFVFLVFSLVVSGINEGITRAFEWRSRHLWAALRQLLDGDTARLIGDARPSVGLQVPVGASPATAAGDIVPRGAGLVDQLYAHPLIRELETAVHLGKSRIKNIPSTDFSRALVDLLVQGSGEPAAIERVREYVGHLPDGSPIKIPLLTMLNEADGIEKLVTWFDSRMAALSATYKKHTRWVMLVIGLVVAVAFNVDAVGAAQRLDRDAALRAAVVHEATTVVDACTSEPDPATCTRNEVSTVDPAIRLPAGWPDPNGVNGIQVFGWLLAGIALGQGAPFWFDLLRKATSIRSP